MKKPADAPLNGDTPGFENCRVILTTYPRPLWAIQKPPLAPTREACFNDAAAPIAALVPPDRDYSGLSTIYSTLLNSVLLPTLAQIWGAKVY